MKLLLRFLIVALPIIWSTTTQSQQLPARLHAGTKHIEAKSPQGNQPPSQKQYGTEQNPLIVTVLPSPKSKAQADYEAYERYEKSKNETRLTWATIWLAIVTTALAIFTGYLWNATRKMVRSTEENAKRQLRAFIFGKGFNHGPNIWDGVVKEYVFWVTWENVGLTPGIDVCNWLQFKAVPQNKEQEIIFTPTTERALAVMGPRATAQTAFITIPLKTMMEKWRNETKIFLWSRVEYRDIFESDIIHHHEQCASIELIHDPSTIPPEGHPPYVTFTVYGHQNSTG